MIIRKVQSGGGNLLVVVPRALARELGWTHHTWLILGRSPAGGLTVREIGEHLAERKRNQENQNALHRGTAAPAPRDD